MTLDLSKIVVDLQEMAAETARGQEPQRIDALRSAYLNLRDEELRLRLRSAQTSWLLATTGARFGATSPVPELSGDYAVVASDGSFILPDRHSPAQFYMINVGKVVLRYGEQPSAEFETDPGFYFRQEDLHVADDIRRTPVNGTVLGLKRAVDELRGVTDAALKQQLRSLALQDGTLILWSLESQSEAVERWVLEPYLETMRRLRDAQIPVAAFISFPGSRDFLNTLRVSICDYPDHGLNVNCDHCRGRIAVEGHTPACDVLPDVNDRFVFEQIAKLQAGDRSQVYASSSQILRKYDEDFRVHFFYLHTGLEIARVEIPQWVAADRDALDFTHAVIVEQCDRGRGYPAALQEAHELAAIRPDERRAIDHLVENALAHQDITIQRSGKDRSKRERFV